MTQPRPIHTASWAGARLRHWGWRLVFDLTGGLSVTGPTPAGPAIVVTNHQSHADTAALLAALEPRYRPMVSAAADYWFANPVKRFAVTSIVSALPVLRNETGAYAALRNAATPVLERGDILIIYPEGTRATSDTMGNFHTGPARLAADFGVPLVPAALLGTRDVLPKNGRFRLRPIEIRFGESVVPDESVRTTKGARAMSHLLKDRIQAMRDAGPIREVVSPVWREVAAFATAPQGRTFAFLWGFAEGFCAPMPGELELLTVGAAVPKKTLVHAAALAVGSAAGAAAHVALRRQGVRIPMLLTTDRMRLTARDQLVKRGVNALWAQPFTGIPLNVYASQAARTDVWLPAFTAVTLVAQGTRMASVGLAASSVSQLVEKQAERVWGRWMLAASAAWALAERRVWKAWG